MKIALPLKNTSELAENFQEGDSLGIFDTLHQSMLLLSEGDISKKYGNISFFELLQTLEVKACISSSYQVMALKLFIDANIIPYKADKNVGIMENIELLKNRKLHFYEIPEEEAELYHSCSSCRSCGPGNNCK